VQKNNEITPVQIDLGAVRKNTVNEGFMEMFNRDVSMVLGAMLAGSSIPIKIKGTKSEIKVFTKTMQREKQYIKTAAKYGLDDPRTYRNKYKLKKAISKFERATGLRWPLEG
tara:strand:+ start:495 stop:830 length:336 start_codon:yes stop_codon:yes gene_type:complete